MNTLGFDKPTSATRVVVAMSGGVDSSATAAMLVAEGYDVVGVTLQLYDHGAAVAKKGACCAGQDIYDARAVADTLGIPHYVLDYESRFKQSVIEDFADSYLKGETPIPCVKCNQTVKFRDLLDTASDLDADCMATGHYVQRRLGANGRAQLHRAADHNRDQSYFLFATTPAQLDFLRFPIGGHASKDDTRALAAGAGLLTADKPDSQDICFVPTGGYADVVAKVRPEGRKPGEIVALDGAVLGHHDGVIGFTIGQRRGLNIGGSAEPLYVVALRPDERRVVVGPRQALARDVVMLRDLNWLGPDVGLDGLPVMVKLRSMQPLAAARILPGPGGTAEVRLEAPQFGVAPGQACVAYAGERCLGGGWITSASLIGVDLGLAA